MSAPGNTLPKIIHVELAPELVCRDERCERLDIHERGPSTCRRRRGREMVYRTRSHKFMAEPWRAYASDAMRESAFRATSFVEPRNFALVLSIVRDDYGSCCTRSLHRHLGALCEAREIVRMDFPGRIHGYLRAGSRLVNDPDLVFEQLLDLHAARTAAA